MRRRIRKEFTWSGSSWTLTNQICYVYDGNLVIQERTLIPQLSTLDPRPSATYARGNDLSGSLEGAGGIGGLLARTDNALFSIGDPQSTASYHSDGNGNVTVLVSAAQRLAAKYLYDPFGSVLSQGGLVSEVNAYCFSSKELHRKSRMALYLTRPFTPHLHVWIGRDRLGEVGFEVAAALQMSTRGLIQLPGSPYNFCHNSPIDRTDAFGLDDATKSAFEKCLAGCKDARRQRLHDTDKYARWALAGGSLVGGCGGFLLAAQKGRGIAGGLLGLLVGPIDYLVHCNI